MKWERHYTGIEIAQRGQLYLQRDTKSKKLQFMRYRWTGLFIGHTNFLGHYSGFEFFTRRYHVGYAQERKWLSWGVKWSGSRVEPYTHWTLLLGRIGFGGRTPKWVQRLKHKRAEKQWEQMAADYDRLYPEYQDVE